MTSKTDTENAIGTGSFIFSVLNAYTFTGYSGMDPEVGSSGNDAYSWASGIDLGFYPSPRTFMFGVNLKF